MKSLAFFLLIICLVTQQMHPAILLGKNYLFSGNRNKPLAVLLYFFHTDYIIKNSINRKSGN